MGSLYACGSPQQKRRMPELRLVASMNLLPAQAGDNNQVQLVPRQCLLSPYFPPRQCFISPYSLMAIVQLPLWKEWPSLTCHCAHAFVQRLPIHLWVPPCSRHSATADVQPLPIPCGCAAAIMQLPMCSRDFATVQLIQLLIHLPIHLRVPLGSCHCVPANVQPPLCNAHWKKSPLLLNEYHCS